MPADLTDNLAAQIQVRDEVAIGMIHDVDRFRADDFCRGILFFMADGAQLVGGHFRVRGGVKAFVATGEEQIGDVMSRACPAGEGCTAEEFGVIGVGEDDEDDFEGRSRYRRVSCFRFQVSRVEFRCSIDLSYGDCVMRSRFQQGISRSTARVLNLFLDSRLGVSVVSIVILYRAGFSCRRCIRRYRDGRRALRICGAGLRVRPRVGCRHGRRFR